MAATEELHHVVPAVTWHVQVPRAWIADLEAVQPVANGAPLPKWVPCKALADHFYLNPALALTRGERRFARWMAFVVSSRKRAAPNALQRQVLDNELSVEDFDKALAGGAGPPKARGVRRKAPTRDEAKRSTKRPEAKRRR